MHDCNTSTREAEAGGSWLKVFPDYTVEPHLKNRSFLPAGRVLLWLGLEEPGCVSIITVLGFEK